MSLSGRAQAYEPGLLVRANGDTLRGEIENAFWNEPPAFIRFRSAATAPSELFQPRQLQAVRFTGGRYFRYETLPIDHAAETRLDRLPQGFYPDVQTESVLADVLVDGPATLLRVVRFGTTHYLLRRVGLPVLDLSERKYLVQDRQGRNLVTDGNNYRGQLGIFFGDCAAAYQAIELAPFTAPGLVEVVQAYNNSCAPTRVGSLNLLAQSKPRRTVALQGGLLAGVRYNRIESVYSGPLDGQCTDCRPRPYGGLYAELLQPSRTQALYGELSVSTFRSQGGFYSTNSSNPAVFIYHPFTYRAWLATARLGLRFLMPLPHEQHWLVGAGYELNQVVRPRLDPATQPAVLVRYQDLEFASPTWMPNLSLGWRSNRATVSLDGQFYAGSSSSDNFLAGVFFSENYSLRLGFGYRLGSNPDLKTPSAAGPQ
ncbi:hypothetical protein GCM10022406_17040 [Hymenobacter algoricola]|uniref:DUF5723 domain-containing protein n=1 Tax=Hymenobacter algoricola TaxID=486267 RepID=A0ABP7N233_9BACT